MRHGLTLWKNNDKVGWGHSSMEDTLQFASLTGVKHLLFTHHDPMRLDEQLHEIYKLLKEKFSYQFPYEFAVEGLKIEL